MHYTPTYQNTPKESLATVYDQKLHFIGRKQTPILPSIVASIVVTSMRNLNTV